MAARFRFLILLACASLTPRIRRDLQQAIEISSPPNSSPDFLGSSAMPQPLSKVKPDCGFTFNQTSLPSTHNAHLAAMAMDVLALWPSLEFRMAVILIQMLGAEPAPAMGMFTALTSSAAQTAAIRGAAQKALTPEKAKVFEILLSLVSRSAKKRNRLAHHSWGYTKDLPDALLLVDPQYQLAMSIERNKVDDHLSNFRRNIFVYKEVDFLEILSDMRRTEKLMTLFHVSIVRDMPKTIVDQKWNELKDQPEIRSKINP